MIRPAHATTVSVACGIGDEKGVIRTEERRGVQLPLGPPAPTIIPAKSNALAC